MLRWRVIRDGARSGAENMAVDHALASLLGDGTGVLRLYSWRRPTVSFGRNEPTRDVYSAEAIDEAGVDLVRRPTGGRAVLHAGELTYGVIVPARALGGARATYARVNVALAGALSSLGARATVAAATGERVPGVGAGPCFQGPAEGEVVAEGRKLVGSAQARIDGALLQHGSIILEGDQTLLERLGAGAAGTPPAALESLIGRITPDRVGDAVALEMEKVFGGSWAESEYSGREKQRVSELVAGRYGRDEWTWRR